LSNLDLRSVELGEGALATLVVSPRESSRYLLFDEESRLVGWTNVKTGEVRSPFGAIDPSAFRRRAFSGIHMMSSRILPLLGEYSRKTGSERFPIMDFYLDIAAREKITGLDVPDLKLVDVGKLETLAAAEDFLASL
ncbi:MAG: nucleotidyltransferase family protein, partial [Bacteroidales bacterium]|nr:nucleotidyltransferase family protein [Bacteroidales bacterium]